MFHTDVRNDVFNFDVGKCEVGTLLIDVFIKIIAKQTSVEYVVGRGEI